MIQVRAKTSRRPQCHAGGGLIDVYESRYRSLRREQAHASDPARRPSCARGLPSRPRSVRGVDLLPTGEVNRLDTALGEQAVDGLGVAVDGHTAAFGRLGEVFQHVGDDHQRVGLGGADQADRPALGPPGGIQRSRTSPPAASVVMRPSPFALARWAPFSS